jgi:glycerol-3-phosphate acyltransferase PlsX
MRRLFAELARRTDYHEVGGSPLLGLTRVAMVCHGSSQARSIASALATAQRCIASGLIPAIAGELGKDGAAASRMAAR